MPKLDPNDLAYMHGPDELRRQLEVGAREGDMEIMREVARGCPSVTDLYKKHGGTMRTPVVNGLLRRGEVLNLVAPPKVGKALAIDTPILADEGWTTMGELRPGMQVHAQNGKLTEIVAATEIIYGRPCYRVTTRSGTSMVADENHLWTVHNNTGPAIVSTKDLAQGRRGRRWLLPICEEVCRPWAWMTLDPWLLGYWLGNGTRSNGRITTHASDTDFVLKRVALTGMKHGKIAYKGGSDNFTVLGMKQELAEMGLLNNKHIPPEYLTASCSQRRDLLAGLLDSDGYAATVKNGSGIVEFCSTDETLARQTLELARSLGHKARLAVSRAKLYGKDCGPRYRFQFAASASDSPFLSPRKSSKLPERDVSDRSYTDAIISVEPVESVPVRCIQVADPSGTFLAGKGYMVTHNSFLAYHLALAVASGGCFLGVPEWQCDQGAVVILDNELHEETIACRIPKVRVAMRLPPRVEDLIRVKCLRGQTMEIGTLDRIISEIGIFEPRLVILDSLYRSIPVGSDENSNADITQVYNLIDKYAEMLRGAAFCVVHHTSKGNQSGKAVTDVGSGAGSQARAVDCHCVLREHELDYHYVIEAVARSFMRPDAQVIAWDYPLWSLTEEDPKALAGAVGVLRSEDPSLSNEEFLGLLNEGRWTGVGEVLERIRDTKKFSYKRAKVLIVRYLDGVGICYTDINGLQNGPGFMAEAWKGGARFHIQPS